MVINAVGADAVGSKSVSFSKDTDCDSNSSLLTNDSDANSAENGNTEHSNDKGKNSFIKSNEDEGIFSNTRNTNNSRFNGPRRGGFIRYSKPRPPTPPKAFNMEEMKDEFPALGN